MLTGARIREDRGPRTEDLQDHDGLRWITTLRAPTIRKLIKAGEVAQTMFDERDLAEISSPDFPGERLVVCRNTVLADQRHRKRQELLAATEDKLAPIVKATQRPSVPKSHCAAPPRSACGLEDAPVGTEALSVKATFETTFMCLQGVGRWSVARVSRVLN